MHFPSMSGWSNGILSDFAPPVLFLIPSSHSTQPHHFALTIFFCDIPFSKSSKVLTSYMQEHKDSLALA